MNVFEKIREKLEALIDCNRGFEDEDWFGGEVQGYKHAIEIVNQVEEEYAKDINVSSNGWIPCSERLPKHSDNLLLIQCSGKPRSNIELHDAFQLASYTEEGWILEILPEWKGADVVAWQPLPEPYKQKGE